MTGSAFYGTPPATEDDLWIIIGIYRFVGLTGKVDPTKGLPLLAPKPPNYVFESWGDRAIRTSAAVIVLMVLITGSRLVLRATRRDLRWGPDDWVIIPAAIGAIAWIALTIPMVKRGGIGKHLWDVTYEEYNWYQKIAAVKQIIFFVTAGLIKISITLFNRRLTGLTSQKWLYAHNIFLALMITYTLSALFVNAFQCKDGVQYDLIKYGKGGGGNGKCIGQNIVQDVFIVSHVVFDFCLLSVPLIILFKMKTNTSKKVRLAFLFSIGSISCIGSAMRLRTKVDANPDRTWAYSTRLNWTIVDIFFAITAASLPVLNAAIPKRWRSPPMSKHAQKIDPMAFDSKESSTQLESGTKDKTRHFNSQHEMRAYSKDTLHSDGESPLVTKWQDPAQSVQHPVPTHRERAESTL